MFEFRLNQAVFGPGLGGASSRASWLNEMGSVLNRKTTPFLVVHLINSLSQAQFAVVLPWIVLQRGGSAAAAVAVAISSFVPYFLCAIPAGLLSDRFAPERMLRVIMPIGALALAAAPVEALITGSLSVPLAILGGLAIGAARPFIDGALFRTLATVEDEAQQMHLQSTRASLSQAGNFGGGSLGLALLGLSGPFAVFLTVLVLQAVALAALYVARTEFARVAKKQEATVAIRRAFTALTTLPRLRRIVWFGVGWNTAAGLALVLAAPVLHSHLRFSEERAAVLVAIAAATVILGTVPVGGYLRARMSPLRIYAVAILAEGLAFALFLPQGLIFVAFLAYPLFLLGNSLAATSSNLERTIASPEQDHSLIQVLAISSSMVGYLLGMTLAALLALLLPMTGLIGLAAFALVGYSLFVCFWMRRRMLREVYHRSFIRA